jgi:nicotinamidase-related amidase
MGGPTAVLLVDVINDFAFEGAEPLLRAAARASRRIDVLAQRARRARVPVIYVNDNFGRWRSDFAATIAQCTRPESPGRRICERLQPRSGDYFILKPQHSAFYSTPLELLLNHLRARTLVVTGFATNLCVVFTANDAHMRGYRLVVPRDCTASNSPELTRGALAHVESALHGDVRSSSTIDFDALARERAKPRDQRF